MKITPLLRLPVPVLLLAAVCAGLSAGGEAPAQTPRTRLSPLTSVRVLGGPFADALKANREYLLALDPDRLLAPFFREAGLETKARPYGNWESGGLDGHTAGHYLSALATMTASGADTPEGELHRRLEAMLAGLDRCQQASGDGYLGGVPGGRDLWRDIAEGRIEADGFGLNGKWVPWYNLHKTFAGLRDAWVIAGNERARAMLVRLGNWCVGVVSRLTGEQMQEMLRAEHGGMNEVLADLHAITGEERFLEAARRFGHRAVLEPLQRHEDRLTGLHANTQIPKVTGLARIATLSGDPRGMAGARYFWENVTGRRTVAFGGNSVSEHFNDPRDFRGMLEHREGPETCNTHNMLRLTEHLFQEEPRAAYADYYERALYNHILASIHPGTPGYVYFTPIRPAHYRVYSQPDQAFWCCVGSGMENPGRYGAFIYAQSGDDLHVNLFVPSELTVPRLGLKLRQETTFPDEPRTRLEVRLEKAATFAIRIRHPGWVEAGAFRVRINGELIATSSVPSSYAEVRREWRDADRIDVELPMRTTVERLPDGSNWVALLHGPIVLAAPSGTEDLEGLRADDTRMGHVARGPLVRLDRVPVLVAGPAQLPRHVRPDPAAGPLRFRLEGVVEPAVPGGVPLVPFFRLHDTRYQMYWEVGSRGRAGGRAANPILWADVPDMAMIRVGEMYYMSSTTMHLSPGLPIMRSSDLVNWELVNYAYDTLDDVDALNLANGRSTYGRGSWASSLRFHQGIYYVTTFAQTTGRTHIYSTRDIEKGPWEEKSFRPALHDHTLFFDDDERVYMLHGAGDLRLVELNPDLSGLKPGGFDGVVLTNATRLGGSNVGLPAEGSQLFKVGDRYYLFNITWPRGGMRTVILHRADKITGPYEGRMALQDKGVAQGGLIDTPQGEWYAYLFRDSGAVGRIPYLVPVRWEDGWPVLGVDGKVPDTLDLPANRGPIPGVVASDEFDRRPGDRVLPLVWQWNHNPDPRHWSVTERPGYLRLTTGRTDPDFLSARNTLTQRTIGPECTGTTAVDVGNLKDGDFAGLALLQRDYGLVGVTVEGGARFVEMVHAPAGSASTVERVALEQETVFLRAECDFRDRADRARFFYSLDGETWTAIGAELRMRYTIPHFMGYRFGLFHYATRTPGGYADFDFFHVGDTIAGAGGPADSR